MKKFKVVSMPCTEAQWNELIPELDRFGIDYYSKT